VPRTDKIIKNGLRVFERGDLKWIQYRRNFGWNNFTRFFRCYSIFMLRFWYCGWSE